MTSLILVFHNFTYKQLRSMLLMSIREHKIQKSSGRSQPRIALPWCKLQTRSEWKGFRFWIIWNSVRLSAWQNHSDWARNGTQLFGLNGEWHSIVRNEFAPLTYFRWSENSVPIGAESFGMNLRHKFGLKKNESLSDGVIRSFTPKESAHRKQISHSFVIDRNDSEMYGFK